MTSARKRTPDENREACAQQIGADALMAANEFGEGPTFFALITAAITLAGASNIPQPLVESVMTKAMLTLREHRERNPP